MYVYIYIYTYIYIYRERRETGRSEGGTSNIRLAKRFLKMFSASTV